MQSRILNPNYYLISFMLSCLIFGFLAIAVASASSTDARGGGWTDKKYTVNGNWSIEHRGEQQVIVFEKNFDTKSGPDLKIFLSPKSIDTVNGNNATDGSILVAPLKNNQGAQEYVVPAGIDLNDYASILIHCEKFSVLWGGSSL